MKSTVIFFIISILILGALFHVGKKLHSDIRESSVNILLSNINYSDPVNFTNNRLRGLPDIVKRYLKKHIKSNVTLPGFVRLKQKGFLKPHLNSDWSEVEIEQYISCKRPGFFWSAAYYIYKFPVIRHNEIYINQGGRQFSEFFSLIKFSSAEGEEISRSSLFKYISEMPFYPATLLPDRHITWKVMTNNRAKLIFRDLGISAAAIFTFNDDDEIIKIQTDSRAINSDFGIKSYPSGVIFSDYKQFGDFKVPAYSETEWIINDKIIKSSKMTLTEIDFDIYGVFEGESENSLEE
ncbi:MAG: hypothetical protein JEY94_17835 [Melioribacteraceae bacterium]|nr:hypothetical protein [Melioribacteraceae bacterium]